MESTNNWKLKEIGLIGALIALIPVLLLVGSLFVTKETEKDSIQEILDKQGNMTKPMKTNSWFSTLYTFPSAPTFSYPAAYKVDESGLGISLPRVNATENTVYGSYVENCSINYNTGIISTSVADYGDWHVEVDFKTQTESGAITFVQGSPYVYSTFSGDAKVSCPNHEVAVLDATTALFTSEELGNFIVQSDQVALDEGTVYVTDRLRLGVLPALTDELVVRFQNESWLEDPKTIATWSIADSESRTTFTFPHASFLTTLWPHHRETLQSEVVSLGSYQTVLGDMQLVAVDELTFRENTVLSPDRFKAVDDESARRAIAAQVNADIDRIDQLDFPEGVYSRGVLLGALSSLVDLTAVYEPTRLDEIVDVLETELISYLDSFGYDPEKKMFIAHDSEFGNKEGNDHHFHYGYYIRSASTLIHYRPDTRDKVEFVIDEMISDIASIDGAERYPRLRSFSVYEGHSWADGLGDFADGNNQESTSEALNAWYSIYLWGIEVDDVQYKNMGQWLFSQELGGVRSYWWGVNNPYADGYDHEMSSIVWGGKRDYSTWFSGEPMHIYGIQMLPITEASKYLRDISLDNRYKQEIDSSVDFPYQHEWGDLYTAFVSYSNPDLAISNLPSVTSSEGMKLRSLLLHTVYANREAP